ncbi:hypothetical protein ACWIG3_09785 [Streptomyces celluloflavus]
MRLLALSALVFLCSVGAMDWPAARIAIGGVRREQGRPLLVSDTGRLRTPADVTGIRHRW